MSYECEFCGTAFGKKYNLVLHQKKARYCLESRGNPVPGCEECGKCFVSNQAFNKHKKTCVGSLNTLIREKEDEIEDLKRKLEENTLKHKTYKRDKDKEVASLKLEIVELKTGYNIYEKEYRAVRDKPTTTYNTTTKNKLSLVNTSTIDSFTLETVKKYLEDDNYSYPMFLQGSLGVKKFILKMIIKGDEKSYVSTDSTRKNFHRLEMKKNWVDDKGALFLTKVFDEIKPLAISYFNKFNAESKNPLTSEERMANDDILNTIMPVVRAIDNPNHKDRKILQDEIIIYIRPHVSV